MNGKRFVQIPVAKRTECFFVQKYFVKYIFKKTKKNTAWVSPKSQIPVVNGSQNGCAELNRSIFDFEKIEIFLNEMVSGHNVFR